MRVSLGKLAKSGIEEHHGPDLHAGAHAALFHYVQQVKSGPAPIGPPSFQGSESGAPEDRHLLDVDVAAETEAMLHREADKHRVSIDHIICHAVLTYLAAIDREIEGLTSAVVPATSPA